MLPLFEEADDSASEIRGYFELGEVYVARRGQQIVGHVQLIASGEVWEVKSVAVVESMQGQGIGATLIRKALDRAFSAGAARVVAATATADIGNLRFYQRLGFRMDRVERDVFCPDRGYPNVEADGIEVRDRVWFSIEVHGRH
ncbi:MAG: GNAT family N-acetyltransferase [Bryobacterales bacterium]|nr:GNAT family N-acetyltransferase [Bryobacterales bacterium]